MNESELAEGGLTVYCHVPKPLIPLRQKQPLHSLYGDSYIEIRLQFIKMYFILYELTNYSARGGDKPYITYIILPLAQMETDVKFVERPSRLQSSQSILRKL